MTDNAAVASAGAALTDGTGISQLLASKVLKDLVLDFLLTIGPALFVLGVSDLNTALAAPVAVAIAVGDALIRVVVRAVLRWATS